MLHRSPLAPVIFLALAAAAAVPIRAQSLGMVNLPASLAEVGTQVVGVFHQNLENKPLAYCEGPAFDAQGNLLFTEHVQSHRIWKVTPGGQGSIFATGNVSNGIEFDPLGRMIVAQEGALGVYDPNGTRTTLPLTGNPNVSRINDLSIGSNGGIFFTNHSTGNAYFYRSPSGAVTTYIGNNPLGVLVPNGIEWIEEKRILLVSSSDGNKVFQFDVSEAGVVSNKRDFAPMPVPDGLTLDEKGNVYVASWSMGTIYVFDPEGKEIGRVTVKNANPNDNTQSGNTSNCIIGGDKALYITGDGGAYKVQLKVGPRKRPGSVGFRGIRGWNDPRGLRLSSSAFNPLTSTLSLRLPDGGGRYTIRIVDACMREVWNAVAGDAGLEWNGQNASGAPIPTGRYLILARGWGGRRTHAIPVDVLR